MNIFAFEPSSTGPSNSGPGSPGPHDLGSTVPQPGSHGPDPLPDREWGLSAGQVFAVVVTIIAVSQVIGMLS